MGLANDWQGAIPTKARNIIIIAVIAVIAVAAAYYYVNVYAAGEEGSRVDFIGSNGTVTTVYVEVADTPWALQQGLMYRTSMDEHKGMLFVFGWDGPQSFWMENTPLPLDMIFINSRLDIVDINHNATPYSTDVFTSRESCRYVVEVNGGFCERHDIGIGDRVRIYVNSSAPTPYAGAA